VKPLAVYDGHTRKRLAFLQNAYNIGYEKPISSLWTARFSMPFSDIKNSYCLSFNLIEIWDVDGGGDDRYVGLFRIMTRTEEMLGTGAYIQYELEHVLSTLIDDTMLGWHEIGNIGVYTPNVIAYVLSQQSEQRWVLDECEYAHQYLYGWQDENLLSALYSIVEPFSETDYYWDFDTTSFPWRLRLLKTDPIPVTDIRYRKNINGMVRTVDPTNLTTRLYCYGYGENDNKLTIAEVNNGKLYLDSPNISKYGVIVQVWEDERYTIADSLKATGEAMLKKLEEPAVTYSIDIQTISTAANLSIGETVRIVNDDLDEYMVVQRILKEDLSGQPKTGQITLGFGTYDISDSLAALADRQRISDTYSQGSESIFTDSFYDNADTANPAEITFRIPENAVHVNEVTFSASLKPFRAYSKAIKGGGAATPSTSDGGATTATSSSGGGTTASSTSGGGSTATSSSGGGSTVTSSAGGSTSTTSGSGGGTSTTSGSGGGTTASSTSWSDSSYGNAVYFDGTNSSGYPIGFTTAGGTSHSHTFKLHAHSTSHSHTTTISSHTHSISISSHSHSISIGTHTHTATIAAHTHTVTISGHTHNTTLENHTHTVTIANHKHTTTLADHTHDIDYGIYKGPTANTMTVYLDNVSIGTFSGSVRNVNLISYMSKNANGNIMRGDHVIKITPNGLTRIEGTFLIRLFTNAHGGAQY